MGVGMAVSVSFRRMLGVRNGEISIIDRPNGATVDFCHVRAISNFAPQFSHNKSRWGMDSLAGSRGSAGSSYHVDPLAAQHFCDDVTPGPRG